MAMTPAKWAGCPAGQQRRRGSPCPLAGSQPGEVWLWGVQRPQEGQGSLRGLGLGCSQQGGREGSRGPRDPPQGQPLLSGFPGCNWSRVPAWEPPCQAGLCRERGKGEESPRFQLLLPPSPPPQHDLRPQELPCHFPPKHNLGPHFLLWPTLWSQLQ